MTKPRTSQRHYPEPVAKYPAEPHDGPGLSQPECARLLGISVRAVQDREYRAIRKMRAMIFDDPRLAAELAMEV